MWTLVLIRENRVVQVAGVYFATREAAEAYQTRNLSRFADWTVTL